MKLKGLDKVEELKRQAEIARQAGKRQEFLKLQKQIEEEEQAEVQQRHAAELEAIKKEFPVGTSIPGLGTVECYKDGCGTQGGWISLVIGCKEISMRDVRQHIRERRRDEQVSAYFSKHVYPECSDRKTKILIGESYGETLDFLLDVMDMDRIPGRSDDALDFTYPETYDYAYKQAVEEGYTDQEAEEKAQEAEGEERDEDYKRWVDAVEHAINSCLEPHKLELVEKDGKYYIAAPEGWHKAADELACTISGYGTFHYNDGKELKEVGPYKSYCLAVMEHIHWMKYHAEVYGTSGYARVYDAYIQA